MVDMMESFFSKLMFNRAATGVKGYALSGVLLYRRSCYPISEELSVFITLEATQPC